MYLPLTPIHLERLFAKINKTISRMEVPQCQGYGSVLPDRQRGNHVRLKVQVSAFFSHQFVLCIWLQSLRLSKISPCSGNLQMISKNTGAQGNCTQRCGRVTVVPARECQLFRRVAREPQTAGDKHQLNPRCAFPSVSSGCLGAPISVFRAVGATCAVR